MAPRLTVTPSVRNTAGKTTPEQREEFAARRAQTLAAVRARRLAELEGSAAKDGQDLATRAWNDLESTAPAGHRLHLQQDGVALLNGYVCRERDQLDDAAAQPPPLSRLASAGGRPLHLHFALLGYAALMGSSGNQIRNAPGRLPPSRGRAGRASRPTRGPGQGLPLSGTRDETDWSKLIGMGTGVGRTRATRVQEALKRLSRLDLVALTEGRPSHFVLSREDGRGRSWQRPELDQVSDHFRVPLGLFTNQWFRWLTAAELATLIAFFHGWRVAPGKVGAQGLGLPESVRGPRYQMSRERYLTMHELEEFGLVEMVTPSRRPHAVGGALGVGETHHWRPVWAGFTHSAREVILERLAESPLPPRLELLPERRALHAARLSAARSTAASSPPSTPSTPAVAAAPTEDDSE